MGAEKCIKLVEHPVNMIFPSCNQANNKNNILWTYYFLAVHARQCRKGAFFLFAEY